MKISASKKIGWVVSIAFAAMLFSGSPTLQDFAFYVLLIISVIGWLSFLLIGSIDIDGLKRIIYFWWISVPLNLAEIAGLIYADHAVLASSLTVLMLLIYGVSYQLIQNKESAQ